MADHIYLVRSVLLSGVELVERKDDISLIFDIEPAETLVAARLACALLGEEPACTDVAALDFTRIA
jgi:hypothetical protein